MHQIYSCHEENLEVFTVISSKSEYPSVTWSYFCGCGFYGYYVLGGKMHLVEQIYAQL